MKKWKSQKGYLWPIEKRGWLAHKKVIAEGDYVRLGAQKSKSGFLGTKRQTTSETNYRTTALLVSRNCFEKGETINVHSSLDLNFHSTFSLLTHLSHKSGRPSYENASVGVEVGYHRVRVVHVDRFLFANTFFHPTRLNNGDNCDGSNQKKKSQ